MSPALKGPRVEREDANKGRAQTSRRSGHGWIAGALVALALLLPVPAAADTVRIVALGDSLTAGYGLEAEDSFPAVLEAELRARGHDIVVVNAGVSGDTTRGGLERLDWAVGDDTDAVIVELGANDALRGIEPGATRENLDSIVGRLVERDIPVLLAGMQAPPNLGDDYAAAFNAIFPDLAERRGVLLYPFFLEGVAPSAGSTRPTACTRTRPACARSWPASSSRWRRSLPKRAANSPEPPGSVRHWAVTALGRISVALR
jgi:acyl-CoA thioesterase I